MKKCNVLDQLTTENNGYIKTSQATKEGFSRVYFHNYIKERNLVKVAHGLYLQEELWPDDLFVMQYRYPEAIFSHELAAYHHDLSDREPLKMILTLPSGKSSSRLNKEGVQVYKVNEDLFELGLIDMNTMMGNTVRIYDKERTVCDFVRSRSNIEIQTFQTVLKSYFKSKDRNIPKLMRYAKAFSIDSIIKEYAEIIL